MVPPFIEVKERSHYPGDLAVIPYGWHFISLCLGTSFELGRRRGRRCVKSVVKRGEVILDPGYESNLWMWQQPVHLLHINLSFALLERFALENGKEPDSVELREQHAVSDPQTVRLLAMIHRETQECQWASGIAVDALGSYLAVHLLRHFNARPFLRDDDSTVSAGLGAGALRRVVDYVQEHLADPIRVAEMAQIAGVSTYYFIRLFKCTVGVSPHRYVLEQRVDRARYWLQHHPEITVSDVALRTGFADPSHLARQLRRFTGRSPSDLRRSFN